MYIHNSILSAQIVEGDKSQYVVTFVKANSDGKTLFSPTCTCADFRFRKSKEDGHCKHVLAVFDRLRAELGETPITIPETEVMYEIISQADFKRSLQKRDWTGLESSVNRLIDFDESQYVHIWDENMIWSDSMSFDGVTIQEEEIQTMDEPLSSAPTSKEDNNSGDAVQKSGKMMSTNIKKPPFGSGNKKE